MAAFAYSMAVSIAASLVVSALFPPPDQEGPKLEDLRLQDSSYGAVISRLWGTCRVAGNVIWATDLVEHSHEEDAGGKGGGASYTTYTYTCSFAVAICDNFYDDESHEFLVKRIWADNKLIYDIANSEQGFTATNLEIYSGSETQDVDPTIQSYNPDTPAYRGLCYCVFTDLDLTKYGNRIPNLTFEVESLIGEQPNNDLIDIIMDLSIASGVGDYIDTSNISGEGEEYRGIVPGFVLSRQGDARSAIEYLMSAFLFDSVESEGKIKFVRRDQDSVVDIPIEDLAVHDHGSDVPRSLEFSRSDEVELPNNINIKYINPACDYQISTQNSKRLTGRSLGELTYDLPVVMEDANVKKVVDYILYSMWAGRTTAKFKTSLKYAKYEPTDIVTIDGNVIRITSRSTNGNILEFDGQMENGITVSSTSVAGSGNPTTQEIVVYGATRMEILDIPILRDDDDNAGFYISAGGYTDGWPGCVVLKSLDGGQSFAQVETIISPSIIGVSNNSLGDFQANIFDNVNSVIVELDSGELYSSSELMILNGGNGALLGDEIIQYKTATLIDYPRVYKLSGLLRGRKGTPTNTHTTGERFVTLSSAALRRAAPNSAEIGLERVYKSITLGGLFSSGVDQPFTNQAKGLECLSPVHLGGGRDPSGNLTITWVRRTRVGGEWRDLVDASLGEVSESYSMDVYTDSDYDTVVRTLTSSTPTVDYTAAQQVTDFGSAQSVVYVSIYQISATMARGSDLRGSI